jgi:hypothetical protein
MTRHLIAALALAALVVTGCGSAKAPIKSVAAHSTTAAPAPAPLPQLSKSSAARVCADLGVLVIAGNSDPFGTVTAADGTWLPGPDAGADVAAAIYQHCPQYTGQVPSQYQQGS